MAASEARDWRPPSSAQSRQQLPTLSVLPFGIIRSPTKLARSTISDKEVQKCGTKRKRAQMLFMADKADLTVVASEETNYQSKQRC